MNIVKYAKCLLISKQYLKKYQIVQLYSNKNFIYS